MDSGFLVAFTASIMAAIIATIGIFTIRYYKDWSERNVSYFICFAAGVLISVTLLHLMPESMEMGHSAAYFIMAGYFGMYLINRLIHSFVCGDHSKYIAIGIMTIIAIGFHSFIDGIIYSITFRHSIFTGAMAATGMILHEFAEGTITYLLLIESKFNQKKATILAFFTAAATTPLGMIVSYPTVEHISEKSLGTLLALSAGILLYVGATHLLPHAEKKATKYSFLSVAAGIVIALIITFTHSHAYQ